MANRPQSSECVRVVVRCRPMNDKEVSDGHERIVIVKSDIGQIQLKNPREPAEPMKSFTFDATYDSNSTQLELYDETFRPLVDSVLEGYNGTIFAYGQTGTGKTFTMEGVRDNPELQGVIPNSFKHIFGRISSSTNQQYLVRASYLEIYQEEIRDLLQKDAHKRLELKERPDIGVYVKDLSSFVTKNPQEIEQVMSVGNQNRSVGSTNMNEKSSRSHAIFIITVECCEPGLDGKPHIRVGKLNLVDLAGSERQAKTGATGQRFQEATKINLSLSALGNVISSLVDGKSSHIPYRDSKLTRLLQDSLGGNARTVMVANVGPASYNYEESMSTLRYAHRAKQIKNKPKINEDPKDTLLREFQEEIMRLKLALDAKGRSGGRRPKTAKISGEADCEIATEDEDTEAERLAVARQKLEQEREKILKNSTIREEEKVKLLKRLEEREAEFKRQSESQQQMAARIAAMESKLLRGGGENAVQETTNAQEEALRERKAELVEQRRREREMLQDLENQDEAACDIQLTYENLQQEVSVKTKKLKKLWSRLQQVRAESNEIQLEHSDKRQELEESLTMLTRELKLTVLILDSLIPPEFKDRILARAFYDEDADIWRLAPSSSETYQKLDSTPNPTVRSVDCEGVLGRVSNRPIATSGNRRPICEYAQRHGAMHGSKNIRFRGENILLLELDIPPRTTRDYADFVGGSSIINVGDVNCFQKPSHRHACSTNKLAVDTSVKLKANEGVSNQTRAVPDPGDIAHNRPKSSKPGLSQNSRMGTANSRGRIPRPV